MSRATVQPPTKGTVSMPATKNANQLSFWTEAIDAHKPITAEFWLNITWGDHNQTIGPYACHALAASPYDRMVAAAEEQEEALQRGWLSKDGHGTIMAVEVVAKTTVTTDKWERNDGQ